VGSKPISPNEGELRTDEALRLQAAARPADVRPRLRGGWRVAGVGAINGGRAQLLRCPRPAALFYRSARVSLALCNHLSYCIGGFAATRIGKPSMRPDLAPPQRGFFVRVLPRCVQPTVVLYRWVYRSAPRSLPGVRRSACGAVVRQRLSDVHGKLAFSARRQAPSGQTKRCTPDNGVTGRPSWPCAVEGNPPGRSQPACARPDALNAILFRTKSPCGGCLRD
jgi:hypothetical protein